jgi:hypothetical protein
MTGRLARPAKHNKDSRGKCNDETGFKKRSIIRYANGVSERICIRLFAV